MSRTEAVETPLKKIFQRFTFKTDRLAKSWQAFSKYKTNSPTNFFLEFIQHFQATVGRTSSFMTSLFHARPDDELKQKKHSCRGDKLHSRSQGPNFLRGRFSNRGKWKTQSNLSKKDSPSTMKYVFLSRTCPSIFILIVLELMERSNKTARFL